MAWLLFLLFYFFKHFSDYATYPPRDQGSESSGQALGKTGKYDCQIYIISHKELSKLMFFRILVPFGPSHIYYIYIYI